jgi:hypothetical protein
MARNERKSRSADDPVTPTSGSRGIIAARVVCAAVGGVALLLGIACLLTPQSRSERVPLHTAFGIAVDSSGRIYVGTLADSSIHVYSQKGLLKMSIPVDAARGLFRFRIEPAEALQVATIRNEMLYSFSLDGELIASSSSETAYTELGGANERRAVDPVTGAVVELHARSILRVSPDGTREEVVRQSWWPSAVTAMLPAPVLVALGVLHVLVAITLRDRSIRWVERFARIRYRGTY